MPAADTVLSAPGDRCCPFTPVVCCPLGHAGCTIHDPVDHGCGLCAMPGPRAIAG